MSQKSSTAIATTVAAGTTSKTWGLGEFVEAGVDLVAGRLYRQCNPHVCARIFCDVVDWDRVSGLAWPLLGHRGPCTECVARSCRGDCCKPCEERAAVYQSVERY